MRRNSRVVLVSLSVLALVLVSFTATSEEEGKAAIQAEVLETQPEVLQTPAQEPKPAESDLPNGYVATNCAVQQGGKILIDREGEPVQSENPNCICPHAGPGWIMTGDSCKVDPGGQTCSGECYWLDVVRNVGTGTPCGTS